MTDVAPRLATALADRYHIQRELDGGGMSRVFLAAELALGREVVIKTIRPELLEGASAERFAREVQLAARLQQANIVPVLASGIDAGVSWYTMPFVRGESLRARLAGGGAAGIAEAVHVLRDVARALSYAHGEGVVHRDIKPENVLLSGGTAVVTDFGIAKALSASRTASGGATLTSVGTSLGTPAYMAPEQAAGDPSTDHRADLYAWGVVAWELLAGRHPFAAHVTPHALVTAHMRESPAPLASVRRDVPAALATLVARCLEKDPARRPQSAGALLEALDEVPIVDTGPRATAARASRSRGRLAVVLLALVLVAAGAWWALQARSGSSDAAAGGAATEASIAVLPFADLSPDKSGAYLGDGVAETLINALSKVPGLTVSARTSAFSMRGQEGDLRAIGRQLGVATVLTGSIQRAGEQLRVTARVVRVANDSILWSESFDRPASDIFAVQDEVARAVTAALRLSIAGGGASREVGGTRNPAAYDAYLLGRYYWNMRTTEGMIRATAAFRKAIEADSMFAQAWSGLADSYVLSVPGEYNVPGVSRDSLLAWSERAARRAIALAPEMGEGHVSLGGVLDVLARYDEALAAFERGLVLSPSYPTGHQWYSYALAERGNWQKATEEMEIAHRLDPLAHVITISLAVAYDARDRFADAAPLYAQGLAQSPQAWYGWRFRFANDLARGRPDDAAVALREAAKDSTHGWWSAWNALARRWDDASARASVGDSLLRAGALDVGIPAVRWLGDDDALAAALEQVSRSGLREPSGGKSGIFALLGPRLSADARVRAALAAVGYRYSPGTAP